MNTSQSRNRMMTAMRGGVPDRVPVCPDISNMIPAILTGKPFWDIYFFDSPSLGSAYLDTIDHLGMDGWYLYGHVKGGNDAFDLAGDLASLAYDAFFVPADLVTRMTKKLDDERMQETVKVETPLGELETTTVCFRQAPPWDTTNLIKDLRRDWPRLRWLMGESWHWDDNCAEKSAVGDRAVYGLQVHTFVDFWDGVRDGQSDQVIMDFYDDRDFMDDVFDYYKAFTLSRVRGLIAAGVDEVLVQGSNSSMSLINPTIYDRYVLPLNVEVSRVTRELGCIGHLHTCGRSSYVVERNMQEATFDVIEPLEKPPGGDVDIGAVKRQYGSRVALKGNMRTSGPLLAGTPDEVEEEVIETLQAAARGGGFILSSGDQVGGNTPMANLERMI
ncbi:MAG: uroporphyrinogen decarboxylase family protein, partial [Rhodothermales bacterium]